MGMQQHRDFPDLPTPHHRGNGVAGNDWEGGREQNVICWGVHCPISLCHLVRTRRSVRKVKHQREKGLSRPHRWRGDQGGWHSSWQWGDMFTGFSTSRTEGYCRIRHEASWGQRNWFFIRLVAEVRNSLLQDVLDAKSFHGFRKCLE